MSIILEMVYTVRAMRLNGLKDAANEELLAARSPPFFKQNYKGTRIIFSDLLNIIKAAVYPIFFSLKDQVSYVEYQLQSTKWHKWQKYGDQVIDFATNAKYPDKQQGATEWGSFQRTYGLQDLDWQPLFGVLSRDKLAVSKAFCGGMSAHFIYCYLKELQSGATPREAVEKVSTLYRDGPPKSAQIAQSLLEAYNCNEAVIVKKEEFTKFSNKLSFICLYLFHCFLDVIKRVAKIVCSCFGHSLEIELKATEGCVEFIMKEFRKQLVELVESRPHFQLLGIGIGEWSFCAPENLNKTLQTLPSGAYYLAFQGKCTQDTNHAIAFIKTGQDKDFIFDSNYATLSVDASNSPIELEKLREHYFRNFPDGGEITFFPCNLNSN
ncbi:MAG: hypothetical protein K1X28_01605 [Parachlamydiales bacterium]|nr:hypothetical protein [Parachlamydiales bacterium]